MFNQTGAAKGGKLRASRAVAIVHYPGVTYGKKGPPMEK